MKFQLAVAAALVACVAASTQGPLTSGNQLSIFFEWSVIPILTTTATPSSSTTTTTTTSSSTSSTSTSSTTAGTMNSAHRRSEILAALNRRAAEVARAAPGNPAPTDACGTAQTAYQAFYYSGACQALSTFGVPAASNIALYATFFVLGSGNQTLNVFQDAACNVPLAQAANFATTTCQTLNLQPVYNDQVAFKTLHAAPSSGAATGTTGGVMVMTTVAPSLTSAGSLVGPSSLLFVIAAISLLARRF